MPPPTRSLTSSASPSKTAFIVVLAAFCLLQFGRLRSFNLNQLSSPDNIPLLSPIHATFFDTPTHEDTPPFKLHTHCIPEDDTTTNKYNATTSAMAQLFQVKENSWELTRNKGPTGIDAASFTLQFQIIECPQRYAASTFHAQARTHQTVFAGSVGPRFKVQEGCGYYNATVPIVPTCDGYHNASSDKINTGIRFTCGNNNNSILLTYPQEHAFLYH